MVVTDADVGQSIICVENLEMGDMKRAIVC